MTIDEQIKLAEQIAHDLPEVTRGEWNKWVQVAEQHGLDKAIQHAQRMSNDVTLRPSIKQANRLLSQKIERYKSALAKIDKTQYTIIWGYVASFLKISEQIKGVLT